MSGNFETSLSSAPVLLLRQRKELAELLGYESRNKYEVTAADGRAIAFAAEQRKGLGGMILRQVFGHWRRFDIQIFSPDRRPVLRAHHPFRIFFQRLEVSGESGALLGALQQRFVPFTKAFDVEDAGGRVLMTTRSWFFKPWTFAFRRNGREVAVVKKRWSGLLKEAMTDADNFSVEVLDPALQPAERALLLAAALFIDLQYFEKKAQRRRDYD